MRSSYLLACLAVFCFVALSSQAEDKVGGYQKLTPKEVLKNAAAKGALNFGAEQIIEKLIAAKKLYKDKYEVSKIIYAARQLVAGINYKFEVRIENPIRNVEIRAEYIVFRSLKGKYSLTSSDYKIKKNDYHAC